MIPGRKEHGRPYIPDVPLLLRIKREHSDVCLRPPPPSPEDDSLQEPPCARLSQHIKRVSSTACLRPPPPPVDDLSPPQTWSVDAPMPMCTKREDGDVWLRAAVPEDDTPPETRSMSSLSMPTSPTPVTPRSQPRLPFLFGLSREEIMAWVNQGAAEPFSYGDDLPSTWRVSSPVPELLGPSPPVRNQPPPAEIVLPCMLLAAPRPRRGNV